jgi:retinol dehydrogenase 12
MTTFFTRSLSDWLGPDAPLVVTNVHPGLVATTLNRNRGVFLSIVAFLMKVLVMRTPEQGARTIAWASLAGAYGPGPAANELRGAYVNSFEINEPSEYVVSKEHDVGRRLWVSHSLACQ